MRKIIDRYEQIRKATPPQRAIAAAMGNVTDDPPHITEAVVTSTAPAHLLDDLDALTDGTETDALVTALELGDRRLRTLADVLAVCTGRTIEKRSAAFTAKYALAAVQAARAVTDNQRGDIKTAAGLFTSRR